MEQVTQLLITKWNETSDFEDLQADVGGKSIWVGAEGSKGTDANTIYFCY